MRRISILLLVFFTGYASVSWPQVPMPTSPLNSKPRVPRFPRNPGLPPKAQTLRAEAARLPASISPDVVQVQCPPEAQALGVAMCGTIPVPLDRQHPEDQKINIYFELYLHTKSGPSNLGDLEIAYRSGCFPGPFHVQGSAASSADKSFTFFSHNAATFSGGS